MSDLIDRLREDIEGMNKDLNIKSITVMSAVGTVPDNVTKVKFIVHSASRKIYKYEAEASPFIFKTFFNKIDKKRFSEAINLISPYITNYKDTKVVKETIEADNIRDIIHQCGGVFKAITDLENTIYIDKEGNPIEPTVYFDDANGSTKTLPVSKVNVENVKNKLQINEGIGQVLGTAALAGTLLMGNPGDAQAKHQPSVTQQEQKIDIDKLLYSIKQIESSGRVNKRSRYEAGVDRDLRKRFNKLGHNLQNALRKYGFQRVATSYGPYQILASTAYDLGYTGTPENLGNEDLSKQYVMDLVQKIINSSRTERVEDVISAYNAGLGRIGRNPEYVKKVMNHYNVNESIINEKIGNFDYSSVQIRTPKEIAEKIAEFVLSIPEEDLYTEEEGYGREIDSHITIKYGLITTNVEEIKDKLTNINKIKVQLGEISDFSDEEKPYDVLKLDVISSDLTKLNSKLSELENEDENPEYVPHLTLAYLKKGKIESYLGDNQFSNIEFEVSEVEFSSKDNVLTRMNLKNIDESTTIEKATEDIQDLINVQVSDPIVKNKIEGDYFKGLANGLIVAKACVDGKEPRFLNREGELEEIELKESDATQQEKAEFFHTRTNKHIGLVKEAAKKIVAKYPEFKELETIVNNHDSAKFEEPEHTPYIELTWNKFHSGNDSTPELMQATFHHVKASKHHPEYWSDEIGISKTSRDESTKCIDASKMPDIYVAEMVADWVGMSIELGKNTARQWYDKVRDTRWHFSTQQNELIDKLLKVFE